LENDSANDSDKDLLLPDLSILFQNTWHFPVREEEFFLLVSPARFLALDSLATTVGLPT
jgi:hypothetical protein